MVGCIVKYESLQEKVTLAAWHSAGERGMCKARQDSAESPGPSQAVKVLSMFGTSHNPALNVVC